MDTSPAQNAISLALHGKWEEAAAANLEIVKSNPTDIDALNRLARAYAESGNIELAKRATQKALDIDSTNPIAIKCLEKWKSIKIGSVHIANTNPPESFIEESGKTKLVTLLHPGDTMVLATVDSGDEVKLDIHPHSISVATNDSKYIGKLPDDLAARLRTLIKNGNKYQAIIKSINSKDVTLFIKETEKSSSLKNGTSFPTEKIDYVSFTPPELVHKDEVVTDTTEGVSLED